MNRIDQAIKDADDAVTKVTKATHTPGAERAGREISRRFRMALPGLPVTNAETLAAIIDAETAAPEMLEALEAVSDAFYRESLVEHRGDVMPKVWAAIQKARGGQ